MSTAEDGDTAILHASAVAVDGRGLLILGPSGAGKSALALQLLALGATLVSDDRTVLRREGAGAGAVLIAAPAPNLDGLIEARFIGLLRSPAAPAPVALVVDMAHPEGDRLPPERNCELLGVHVPLCRRVEGPHFGWALMTMLRHGRAEPAFDPEGPARRTSIPRE
ncbi:serine kinase [Mesobaculum littorinae]|uniref:Serine kinase n=1 Tax=Mesobaculum littorinae TaxID=2486419 RepID=A0A438AFP9_9RHOB|nr:serine kinase [Mesobaculum littorinae]RVV97508.1 serine kinase [Mesobaculum littorinae]